MADSEQTSPLTPTLSPQTRGEGAPAPMPPLPPTAAPSRPAGPQQHVTGPRAPFLNAGHVAARTHLRGE